MTSIARKARSEEKKAECLERIERASGHLLDVINNVLDMSKIEANKLELAPAAFNVRKMIHGAADVLSFRIEEMNHTLTIDVDDAIPADVIGDGFRLTQVITNLLANAVKFTPKEGAIRLRATLQDDEADRFVFRVEVEDNGIGISEEHKSRLFDAFEQAEGGTARKYGGTGLGLAICKQIVEMMGGSIGIESKAGEGSTFAFAVPLLKTGASL
jgi:signal transduction histidine kinase